MLHKGKRKILPYSDRTTVTKVVEFDLLNIDNGFSPIKQGKDNLLHP